MTRLRDDLPALTRILHHGQELGERAVRPAVGAGRRQLYDDLQDAVAAHRVANRPDRYEPRVKRRRRNHYG